MQRLFVLGMAAVLAFSTNAAWAQLVQVAPGFVKAPFVRVWWCPDGTTRVRAPFVDVVTPGHRRVSWAQSREMPAGAPQDFSQQDWQSLRATIRQLASNLDTDLGRFRTGDLWKGELKTAEIRDLVPADNGPPTPEQVTALHGILPAFEKTRGKTDTQMISGLQSFQSLESALHEYLSPATDRMRRQLTSASDALYRALDRTQTGKTWQKYLALPDTVAQAPLYDAPQPTESDLAELEKVRQRFDSVSGNEEYRATTQMPEFKATRDRLNAYLGQLGRPTARALPAVEELELPAPRD